MDHEAHLALGTDRGQHLQRKPCAGARNHRGLAHRRPGVPGVVIRAHARLVGEENHGVLRLGLSLDRGKFLAPPLLHPRRIPLVGPAQRPLRAEAQPPQQPAHRGLAQPHTELAADQLPHHGAIPQGKREVQLQRVAVPDHARQLAHLQGVELRFAARARLRLQGVLTAVMVLLQPPVDGTPIDIQIPRQVLRMDSGFDPAHHPKAQAFLLLAGQLAPVGLTLAFHETKV
jgi:hypothetical protein